MCSEDLRNEEKIWRGRALRVCLFVLALTALSGRALAQDVRVGDTKDGCDGSETVTFQGKTGQVSVKAGVAKRVELPALTKEITWFCGGDRNRSANDEHFNVVKISRADNGAIKWVFFKSSPTSASTGPDLVRVGDTKDGCDGSRHVRFKAGGDEVKVKAGESKLVALSSPRNTLGWSCVPPSGNCPPDDNCDESVSNPVHFDTVQVERAGNGAISWVFYLKKNSAPAGGGDAAPDFVRNANGNVRVGVSAGPFKKEFPLPPGLLKSTLDKEWTARRADIRAQVREQLIEQGQAAARKLPGGRFVLDSLTVAGADDTELRTAAEGATLSLKYVAHGNAAQTRFTLSGLPDPELSITFDIELEVSVGLDSLAKPPQAKTAVMRLGHAEIEGKNVAGNIAQEVFKSKLRDAKTRANNVSRDFGEEVNQALADNWPKPPKDLPVALVKADISVTPAGTVRFCLRAPGAAACPFPGAEEAAHKPRVLDSDIDRCGSSRIWLRDASKRKFVSIPKGKKGVIVEVESREFPWFCGGDVGPEETESAAGPVGTYLLRVSRAPTGDRIDWSFLSWR